MEQLEQFNASQQIADFEAAKSHSGMTQYASKVGPDAKGPTRVLTVSFSTLNSISSMLLKGLEARVGIEPTHKGFADLSLTTWVPRPGEACFEGIVAVHSCRSLTGWHRRAEWSGRRDLNSRPSPWQGDALPLSYSRVVQN